MKNVIRWSFVVQHRDIVRLKSFACVDRFNVLGATAQKSAVFVVQPDVAEVVDVVARFKQDVVAVLA